jgi:hypothetical protein
MVAPVRKEVECKGRCEKRKKGEEWYVKRR